MVTNFTTRILRKFSSGRLRIVDGGCGAGIHALFLAKRNANAVVYGYDIALDKIETARAYQQKHGVKNACFEIASHDDYNLPESVDMIYTCESLVGEEEISMQIDPLIEANETMERRFLRFNQVLSLGGIYIPTWMATYIGNRGQIGLANKCGFQGEDVIEGEIMGYNGIQFPYESLKKQG